MTTETRPKTAAEMLAEAPQRWGALLARWERDVWWLSDYRTPSEQDSFIQNVALAIRNRLQYEFHWTYEAANAMAIEYASTLKQRLVRPEFFNPAAYSPIVKP